MAHVLLLSFVRLVVPLFFIGMVGSAFVVLLTVIRDLSQITRKSTSGPELKVSSPIVDAGETHS